MNSQRPFHRRSGPHGPGCQVAMIPVQGRAPGGAIADASLLDAGPDSKEIQLLRTVATGLGAAWGDHEVGWWATVPTRPASQFVVPRSQA
jgi:hypothetical protein